MKNKYLHVLFEDVGKGYTAIEILTWCGYVSCAITIIVMISLANNSDGVSLIGIISVPFYIVGVYLLRLVLRGWLAARDSLADEKLDLK